MTADFDEGTFQKLPIFCQVVPDTDSNRLTIETGRQFAALYRILNENDCWVFEHSIKILHKVSKLKRSVTTCFS